MNLRPEAKVTEIQGTCCRSAIFRFYYPLCGNQVILNERGVLRIGGISSEKKLIKTNLAWARFSLGLQSPFSFPQTSFRIFSSNSPFTATAFWHHHQTDNPWDPSIPGAYNCARHGTGQGWAVRAVNTPTIQG